MRKPLILVFLLYSRAVCGQDRPSTDELDKLANDFWVWRTKYALFTGDDVNRMERRGGVRDWSAAAIDKRLILKK